MRTFVVLFAVVAAASAASIAGKNTPPVADNSLLLQEYLPPDNAEEQALLNDNGYRYKIVRKHKFRHRRDVNELPANEYLPSTEETKDDISVKQLVIEQVVAPEETAELSEDGYRYKTVRRLKYRHRRDVSEVPANEYLPSTEEAREEIAVEQAVVEGEAAPEEKTELSEDGYRYKTVRHLKYRHRRDVSELPANEYLPSAEEAKEEIDVEQPVVEEEAAPEEKTELSEDGYRYKTVRRLKYRHRRDVSELPANEYLPYAEEAKEEIAIEQPVVEEVVAPEEKTELSEDGYRYKTVRRLKYRHRRDVSELPANEYLPSAEEAKEEIDVEQPVVEGEVAPEEKTELSEDGYRYKTVRRLKYRHRRDVSELPANEYLPYSEEAKEEIAIEQPVAEEVIAPEEKTELSEDGYRYKTVRRLKYRHRRDVSELPANEYLPSTEEAKKEIAIEKPVVEEVVAPEEKTELSEDGYRYKTVRRLKYRHRRDVSELPANEYLPSAEEAKEEIDVEQPVVEGEVAPEEKTELSEDGYRYKTVRRLKYRHRRDVSELPTNEYLPSTEEAKEEIAVEQPVVEEEVAPEEKTELSEDGYRYKTVRRLKYRHRRDVSELPANEYLPSTEVAKEEIAVEQPVVEEEVAPEEKTELSDDGYRYKTVRRLKYRHRRDVSELPANEYLPSAEEAKEEIDVEQPVVEGEVAPEEKTELSEDGYRYKTVRRLKYRHRRDVSELPTNEYLPSTEEAKEEIAVEQPVVEEEVAPEEKTELSEDGYRYKTVRRLKYRHRRDVSEVPANEYLPSTEEAKEEIAVEQPVVEEEVAPEEKTELSEDGYRYKTVRRLKYRHRRDVNELPANEYLPSTEEAKEEIAVEQPVVEEEAAPEEKTELSEDGYRYKTVRRLKYRHRRDVNELPANEYLPSTEAAKEEIAVEQAVVEGEAAPEEKTELSQDGYRYKTVRRLKYRHRRDVSEVPANEYLPSTEEAKEEIAVEQPVVEEEVAPEEKTELSEDGYRYKTVRRLKYRHRRDVSEVPTNEYLPSTEEAKEEIAVEQPVVEEEVAPEEKTELSEDGYRYKTVRRLKYRHRRDVNELPANEYLPSTEEAKEEIAVEQPVVEEEAAPEEKTELSEDGYRYKTVRRLKYRHRRDVNELPANEYLPSTEEAKEEIAVEQAVVEGEAAPEEKTELSQDGYRYKTVRRLKYRHRRDVSEVPANEYLPSTEEAKEEIVVEQPVVEGEVAPEEKTELSEDGYRYKTVRRLKYRHRRDVSEVPANEYLPSTEEAKEEIAVEQAVVEGEAAPEEKTELSEDGYRYKTVLRLKYRHRRDVGEVPANEYLPSTEEAKEEIAVEQAVVEGEAAPEEKTELSEDGYRYKTVRRLTLRRQ